MPEAMRVRYSTVAIILHWTIAALVVANVLMGWQFEELSRSERTALMQIHKANGMTIHTPSPQLKADMRKVGETMLQEWLQKAGPEGQQLVNDFRK